MTSPFTIREYCGSDEAAVIGLVRELQAHELELYDLMKPPEEIGRPYLDVLRSEVAKHKGNLFVAEVEGTLAGYAALLAEVSSEDDPDEKPHTYAYVNDLAVSAEHRGMGIGKALLDACAAAAKAKGQDMIRISVLARNMRARAVYAAAGYHEHLITLTKPLS